MGSALSSTGPSGPVRHRLLVVDDDEQFLTLTSRILQSRFDVETCRVPEEALERLEFGSYDALLVDLYFDEVQTELDGFDIIERAANSELPIIVLSRTQDTRDVTRALELGAFHFVTKYFERDELANLIERAARSAFYERQYEIQRHREAQKIGDVVYKSEVMQRALGELQRYANSPIPVLLTGESGTGKDLMARLVHVQSGRKGSYQAINIAALPDTLFERELFGNDRGAFTDAYESKRGVVEQAHEGTLFIDEIGALSRERQAALLRVIEDGVVRRLGSEVDRSVDVRFVFATNDRLDELRASGSFRDDLWYRISQLQVHLPALRDRGEDVLYIADSFLSSRGRQSKKLSSSARELLLQYHWPGNVRELRSVLHRAVLFDDDGKIDREDLVRSGFLRLIESEVAPEASSSHSEDGSWTLPSIQNLMPYESGRDWLGREYKRRCLEHGLAVGGGSITRATEILGVSRQTLYSWMKELGYDPEVGAAAE